MDTGEEEVKAKTGFPLRGRQRAFHLIRRGAASRFSTKICYTSPLKGKAKVKGFPLRGSCRRRRLMRWNALALLQPGSKRRSNEARSAFAGRLELRVLCQAFCERKREKNK